MSQYQNTVAFQQPTDYGLELQGVDRQRKLAEALMQQSQQPMSGGEMVGNRYVPKSWTQSLSQALKGPMAMFMQGKADEQAKGVAGRQREAYAAELAKFGETMNGTPARTIAPLTPNDDDGNVNMPAEKPAVAGNRQAALAQALGAQNPMLQQAGMTLLKNELEPQNIVVGRSLLNKNTGAQIGTDSTWQGEQVAARDAKAAELAAKIEDAKTSRAERADLQRELAQMRLDGQRELKALAGALKPEKNAQIIQTETGPMQLVNGQAVPIMGPGGAPIGATKEPALLTRQREAGDALQTIKEAEQIIPKATGSYVGAGVDQAARLIGMSTSGAQSAAQLKALEGDLVSKMPKMSGPQSDKDVLLYRQMAGQIGDPTIPKATKMAALETIKAIQTRHSGRPATQANAPFNDAGKESRYQEWKRSQGK